MEAAWLPIDLIRHKKIIKKLQQVAVIGPCALHQALAPAND